MDSTTETSLVKDLLSRLAPGGRDIWLIARRVPLSVSTQPALYGPESLTVPRLQPGSRPELEQAALGIRGEARPGLATASTLTRAIARLQALEPDGRDRPEEEVLSSGAATTLERARLLALLAQAAGLLARVCILERDEPNQALHAVCEIRIMDAWTVFDPLSAQFFLMTHRPYASAWDIMRQPAVIDRHPEHGRRPTVDSSFYRRVSITTPRLDG